MAIRPRPLCRICGRNQMMKAGGLCRTCKPPEILTVRLDDIDLAASWQPREHINRAVVASYAEIMEANQSYDPFPPVILFRSKRDDKKRVGDGFQRLEAAFDAGFEEVTAEVREGEYEDAKLFAASANARHGERMTSADKRRAVTAVLEHSEGRKWSNETIARWCGVSPPTVAAVRSSLQKSLSETPPSERAYVTKHGTVATMKTGAIGKVTSTPPPDDGDAPGVDDPTIVRTVDRSEGEPDTPDEHYVEHDGDTPDQPEDTPETSVNGTPPTPEKVVREKPEPADPEDETGPCDPAGVEIPSQAAEAFALRKGMHAACRKIDALVAEVKEIGHSAAGVHLHYQSVETHLKNARQSLWAARPTHVCPYCVGHKPECQACKGQGWVTARLYDAAPASLKGGA
jgi:hypothetical protein